MKNVTHITPANPLAMPATDELITKRELARRLRLSTRTIDAWMRTKHLPYLKCGKTVRFLWTDVLEKLNAFRVN
jgi:excisionase family DNA binding protein